jgi:hypothetical protein
LLFGEHLRTDTDLKSRCESEWAYLDRSDRVEARRVRAFLNRWAAEYPAAEQDELSARLRSEDDRKFESASFEITLFALLRSLGCDVVVHPALRNGSDKHPDFLATTPSGEPLYAEAATTSGHSHERAAATRRANTVLDLIDGRVVSPDLFLFLDVEGEPETPPEGRKLVDDLQQWIDGLDSDTVSARIETGQGLEHAPQMTWEHEGWKVVFSAVPMRPDACGKGHRPVGAVVGEVLVVDDRKSIRDAVLAKGGRYGELELPFLVCVNFEGLGIDERDEIEALFGQEQLVRYVSDPAAELVARRRPNGAWTGRRGPRYTRVSAAWLFRSVSPWNVASRKSTVYLNPWSSKPLPAIFRELDHAVVVDNEMNTRRGRSLSDVLGLPADWPE